MSHRQGPADVAGPQPPSVTPASPASPAGPDDPWQRAQKVAHEAAALGFDWPTLEGTLEKTAEELAEVRDAHRAWLDAPSLAARADRQRELECECGDVLFSALNVCRLAGVDPAAAIEATTAKFLRRLATMRRLGLPSGGRSNDLAQWQRLWQEAKRIENEA